jgi:hypothetical protein
MNHYENIDFCRLSKTIRARCDGCGRLMGPGELHLPEEDYGWWCYYCCPVCSPEAGRIRKPTAAERSHAA